MTEKTTSKYLINLEKHFANDNPVLLKSAKIFHELDQIEYDLGLIEMDDTTACKNSWWPIVSVLGGNSTAKSRFINSYLGSQQLHAGIQASSHKFTVLLHNSHTNSATLPGTALDVDPRYPFYQISSKIERLQKGEGDRVNSYLELKTIHSDHLKGKLFIDAPNMTAELTNPINSLLTQHIIETSDLVLVFTDVFESASPMLDELIQHIITHQDSNRFVYLVDEPLAALNPAKSNEIIAAWQRKLLALGLNTGQFIIVPNQQHSINPLNKVDFSEIDERMANVSYDRSYRVLDSLEKSIRDIENVVIPEVKKGIVLWKDRVNMTSLIFLSFIAILAVFAAAAVVATGCVQTVTDTNTLATSWSRDSVAGRYQRSVDQVYQASVTVIQQNGVLLTEYIPHDSTNNVRSLMGRVNDLKVWVRVEGIDSKTTQVDVQARSKWGMTDINVVHELEKEIALQLAR